MSWLIRVAAGSKLATMYLAVVAFASGYKTYVLGVMTILRGVVLLIDAMQGTTISDVLELARHPGIEQITLGLGMMTVRAGIEKNKS